ncbi:MAG: hypothetical protein ACLGSA_05650 [Acidobacteriota bacterium]
MKVILSRVMKLALHAVFLAGLLSAAGGTSAAQAPAASQNITDLLFAPFDAFYAASVLDAKASLAHLKQPPSAPVIQDISPENKALIWKGEPGASQVLVTTFTKSAYYSNLQPGQTIPAAVDLWVVPAPQLYTEIRAEDPLGAQLAPRLAASQYLGLPPRNTNDAVVSLWVDPAALLRPAIDPRTGTHELETSFPVTLQNVPLTPAPALPKDPPAPGFSSVPDYASWFLDRQSVIYEFTVPGGPYPWTGLGYTYNWNPAAPDVVGASEFIVPRGAPVTLRDVTPVGEYFK